MDNKECCSEERAAKFGLNMKEYSDENIAVISDFLYHCMWHDLFKMKIQNPMSLFIEDIKSGKYEYMPQEEFLEIFGRFRQKNILWTGEDETPVGLIMEMIFKKCPKDEALLLIGYLVRYMLDPSSWAIDANMFNDLFGMD